MFVSVKCPMMSSAFFVFFLPSGLCLFSFFLSYDLSYLVCAFTIVYIYNHFLIFDREQRFNSLVFVLQ
jgi:hypothetical protein